MNKAKVSKLIDNFSKARVLVLGDIMLDRYVWGNVERISPEAPVPVIEVSNETSRLGCAANVAHNQSSLGAIPIPIGIVEDYNKGLLTQELIA